jgi:hypothetical protein
MYLVYLCSLVFLEFLIYKPDDNYSMFQYSFHIGCYGYKKNTHYAMSLLQNYDRIKAR